MDERKGSKPRLSLARKFALFIGGQTLLFTILFFLVGYFSVRDIFQTSVIKRYSAVVRGFALSIESQLATHNELGLDDVSSLYAKEDGVESAYVLDGKGIYLTHSDYRLNWKQQPLYKIVTTGKMDEKYYLAINTSKHLVYIFTYPVLGNYIASIEVPYSIVQRQIFLFLLKFSIIFFFVFAGSVIAIYFIVKHLVRPIKELAHGVEIIGSGNFNHHIQVRTDDEIGMLTDQFNRMTMRIRKAQELRLTQERMKNELEIAAEVQQKLIPDKPLTFTEYDIIHYYSPAKEIGGDYYDFFPLPEKRLGFVMADVAGKGVPAALVMSMLKTIFLTLTNIALPAKEVLVIANTQLKKSVKLGVFAAVTYGILNREQNTVEFAMAGSERIIRFNSLTRKTELIKTEGFPLGIEEEKGFRESLETQTVTLEKGDALFLYTDGLTDVQNGAGEYFGTDGITAFIENFDLWHQKDFSKKLVDKTVKFRGSHKQEDDLSFILLMRNER